MKSGKYGLLPALALVLALAGCGGPLVKVKGRVTYQGQPVPSTLVTFMPDDAGKRPSHGLTDVKGHFMLNYSSTEIGALPGKYTVFLKYHPSAQEDMGQAEKPPQKLRDAITKYGDPKTSGLHYEITQSGQVIEIKLE